MSTILKIIGALLGLGVILLFLFGVDPFLVMFTNNQRSGDYGGVYLTVSDKERIMNKSDNGSHYLIWSEEGEVFENTDQLFIGKFNSSDIQGQLKSGNKYHCSVYGIRNQFFSWYRNIYDCVEVNE